MEQKHQHYLDHAIRRLRKALDEIEPSKSAAVMAVVKAEWEEAHRSSDGVIDLTSPKVLWPIPDLWPLSSSPTSAQVRENVTSEHEGVATASPIVLDAATDASPSHEPIPSTQSAPPVRHVTYSKGHDSWSELDIPTAARRKQDSTNS